MSHLDQLWLSIPRKSEALNIFNRSNIKFFKNHTLSKFPDFRGQKHTCQFSHEQFGLFSIHLDTFLRCFFQFLYPRIKSQLFTEFLRKVWLKYANVTNSGEVNNRSILVWARVRFLQSNYDLLSKVLILIYLDMKRTGKNVWILFLLKYFCVYSAHKRLQKKIGLNFSPTTFVYYDRNSRKFVLKPSRNPAWVFY